MSQRASLEIGRSWTLWSSYHHSRRPAQLPPTLQDKSHCQAFMDNNIRRAESIIIIIPTYSCSFLKIWKFHLPDFHGQQHPDGRTRKRGKHSSSRSHWKVTVFMWLGWCLWQHNDDFHDKDMNNSEVDNRQHIVEHKPRPEGASGPRAAGTHQ